MIIKNFRARSNFIFIFIQFLRNKFSSYSVVVLKIIIVFVLVLVNDRLIIFVLVLILVHEYITAVEASGVFVGVDAE